MSTGLKATFDFLARTENEAAVDILVESLDCPHKVIQRHALRAVLERRSVKGHREVFKRLLSFDESCRSIIEDRAERLISTVNEMLKDPRPEQCKATCDAIVSYRLCQAIPALVSVLNDPEFPLPEVVADAILKLAEAFYEELSATRGGTKTTLKGQEILRQRITMSLEDAVRKFHRHGCNQPVEALLMIAKSKNVALRTLLQRPDESSHEPIVEMLTHSQQGGVIRLLLGFLEDPHMPRVVAEIIGQRVDAKFVDHLLRKVGPKPSKTISATLSQFKSFAWARPGHEVFEQLSDEGHEGAVNALMASAMEREQVLEMIGFLLTKGRTAGRQAAAKALVHFASPAATALVVRGLNDEDPLVRANVIPQIRPRKIPGALSLLIGMVDNPPLPVQEALRTAMPEFTLRQFLSNYDAMDEDLRITAGHIVRKIDPDITENLTSELEGPSPVRRRRAIQAALAMGIVSQMEEKMIELVNDSDHLVRVAAAEALAECKSMPSWEALRDALIDRSVVVQEAAESSLERISRSLAKSVEDDQQAEEDQTAAEAEEQPQEAVP